MADLVVPALGESITEAIVGRWLKGIGDHVEADEPVVDLETDKITVQLPAPAAGALTEQRFAEGDTVQVGDVVGHIDTAVQGTSASGNGAAAEAIPAQVKPQQVASAPAKKPQSTVASTSRPPERDGTGRPLSPSMRRAYREGDPVAVSAEPRPAPASVPQPSRKREEIVPMSPLRKRIAERLVQAQQSSASLTTFNEVDMSYVMALRSKYKAQFLDTHGVKLGFMSFFVKATVAALQRFPGLNAELRDDAIVYKKHYDIGIAVGTKRGLVVPVLRDCEQRSFAEVEQGIVELAVKARDTKLVLDDLLGGTFTITNGGVFGSMMSTPLLNFPQTGILGMHNIVKRPVVVGDSVEVRPIMYIAATYDHRVVDGSEAVQFLVALKERVEQPDRLLFGL